MFWKIDNFYLLDMFFPFTCSAINRIKQSMSFICREMCMQITILNLIVGQCIYALQRAAHRQLSNAQHLSINKFAATCNVQTICEFSNDNINIILLAYCIHCSSSSTSGQQRIAAQKHVHCMSKKQTLSICQSHIY